MGVISRRSMHRSVLAFWAIVIAVAFATEEDGNDANSVARIYDVNQLPINRRRSQALYVTQTGSQQMRGTCADTTCPKDEKWKTNGATGTCDRCMDPKTETWDMCDEKSNAGPKVTTCHSDKCQSNGDPGK